MFGSSAESLSAQRLNGIQKEDSEFGLENLHANSDHDHLARALQKCCSLARSRLWGKEKQNKTTYLKSHMKVGSNI